MLLIRDYLGLWHPRWSTNRKVQEAEELFMMGSDDSPLATRVFDGCSVHHFVAVDESEGAWVHGAHSCPFLAVELTVPLHT